MVMKLIVAVLIVLGLGLAVRIYMSRPAEDALRRDEHVEIRDLRDPLPANAFLACPPDYCRATAAPGPVFAVSAERLAELWGQMLAGESNVVIVAAEPERGRLTVIQHTPLLHFPDVVTAEFVALGAERGGIAVYSRARYGSGDFGTNRKRVVDWLGKLQKLAGQ